MLWNPALAHVPDPGAQLVLQPHHRLVGLGQGPGRLVEMFQLLLDAVQQRLKSRDRRWYVLNPPANAGIDLEERRTDHFAQGINI